MSEGEQEKPKILIVEDDAVTAQSFQTALVKAGYYVWVARDGVEGWEFASARKPNLVLLDIKLPRVDGFEVLKKIRADESLKQIPVIILSMFGDRKQIYEGLALGANDYVIKGFYSLEEVLHKIQTALTPGVSPRAIQTFRISVAAGIGEAAKLQYDVGLSKLFDCPRCFTAMTLELIPDATHTNGHWFLAHFVCPKCDQSV